MKKTWALSCDSPLARFPARYLTIYVVLGIMLVLSLPILDSGASLQTINLAFIYGIAALGLNVIFGLSGLLSIAQAAVMGIGGYTVLFATESTIGIMPAMVLACISGAVLSGLTGIASARIRSHYFVILTLALAEAFLLLIENNPSITGGSDGMPIQGADILFGLDLTTSRGLFFVVMPLLLVSWYLTDCFKRSRPGLALRVLNTDEYLAWMTGIATSWARLYATMVGGALAGLAGALLAIDGAYIGPQNYDIDTASFLLLIIVLGGPGSNGGTVVAAVILTYLAQGMVMVPTLGQLFYGIAIVALIVAAPGGLAGLSNSLWKKVVTRAS